MAKFTVHLALHVWVGVAVGKEHCDLLLVDALGGSVLVDGLLLGIL